MFRPSNRTLIVPLFAVLAVLMAGCETNDPRFSSQTQYLGGNRGPAPSTGAPQDTISYWDGDGIAGKPSIKISLHEQRAYFYKSGTLVGISQLSTGREGLNTPVGKFSIIQKDRDHVSTKYGDFVDDHGNVVKANVSIDDKNRRARISKVRRCRISCASSMASACTPVICQAIPLRTAASGCRNSWPKIFSNPFPPERRSRS